MFAADYAAILEHTTPYVISFRGNWSALDFQPWGIDIPDTHRFCPTRLATRDVVEGLHHLDRFSFGPQAMLMPRWVLYDCGEFPGIVTGFGVPAAALPDPVREAYHVEHRPDAFVPLSMWVAVPTARPGGWFGHNLSSANLIMPNRPLPGLGTLTKALGLGVTRVKQQYGATQWGSRSLHVHLHFGDLHLLSAFTPAHTHAATFTYRLDVDPTAVRASLAPGWQRPMTAPTMEFAADDGEAILDLHARIEAGEDLRLLWTEAREGRKPWMLVG
ncbi:MAG: hypothetical protein KC613_12730 [Myxococcales bacterium]|nr:hypothetical protein [Myxococcales bacterium]MCB9524515.1 hypothetical protein [Myxococcales bacterium]